MPAFILYILYIYCILHTFCCYSISLLPIPDIFSHRLLLLLSLSPTLPMALFSLLHSVYSLLCPLSPFFTPFFPPSCFISLFSLPSMSSSSSYVFLARICAKVFFLPAATNQNKQICSNGPSFIKIARLRVRAKIDAGACSALESCKKVCTEDVNS